MSRAPYIRGGLQERFWAKVDVRGPDDCWLFQAAGSRSGRREVCYAVVSVGPLGAGSFRGNRLALLLKTAPVEVPRDEGEPFLDWLRRANRAYSHMDASHTCDTSMCCNPNHLEWQSHGENVTSQRRRRRGRAVRSLDAEVAYA